MVGTDAVPARVTPEWGRTTETGLPTGLALTPVRITVIYLVLGMVALVLSDVVFVRLFSEPLLSRVQALKGGLEVVLTAGLIYGLTREQRSQLEDALERMKRHRDELQLLHRVVRHNLRNDVTVIDGFLGLLEEEVSTAAGQEQLQKLGKTVERMERYIEHLHRIKEVTDSETGSVQVDLSEELPELVADHPAVTDEVEVTTTVPGEVEVTCNHMLQEACSELITNAIEHNTADDPKLRIDVDPDAGPPDTVGLRFTDNGPGMPVGEIQALDTEGQPPLLHSTGLGLWFVDWMITHSGGELTAHRVGSEGTILTLYLPRSQRQRDGGYLGLSGSDRG